MIPMGCDDGRGPHGGSSVGTRIFVAGRFDATPNARPSITISPLTAGVVMSLAAIGMLALLWPGALGAVLASMGRGARYVAAASAVTGVLSLAVCVLGNLMQAAHCRRRAAVAAVHASSPWTAAGHAFRLDPADAMLDNWRAGLAAWGFLLHVCCWAWFLGSITVGAVLV